METESIVEIVEVRNQMHDAPTDTRPVRHRRVPRRLITSNTSRYGARVVDADRILARYERDGFVVVPEVLDAATVRAAGAHVDWLQARHPDRAGEDFGHDLIADDRYWIDLVSDDRLLDLAQLFIGADIALFASHYITKPPRSGRPVLWHQDAGYWPLDPMRVVTLWLAIDHSTRANGCLRVVPGSHRDGIHERSARTSTACSVTRAT
jgi:phytanoyl-CoA hydroxylase